MNQVKACGVCHTDLHAIDGDWPVKPNLPLIPGHEGNKFSSACVRGTQRALIGIYWSVAVVGEIVEVGSAVKRLKKGDRVGVSWLYDSCGYCSHCLTGWETLCHQQHNTGYSVNGGISIESCLFHLKEDYLTIGLWWDSRLSGYAEYMVAPSHYVALIPEGMDDIHAAPLLCAGLTTYKGWLLSWLQLFFFLFFFAFIWTHTGLWRCLCVYKGLKQTETKPGQWCVIFGVGGLGHLALQYAKSMGMSTIAVDIADDKLQLAIKEGAEITINAMKEDPGKQAERPLRWSPSARFSNKG